MKHDMDAVLTNYALSQAFWERLETVVAPDPLRLSVSELRQRSLMQMMKYLRSLRVDNLFLPVEDENGAALLPVLNVLASVVPARNVYLIQPDLRLQRITRLDSLLSVGSLILASLLARTAVWRVRREATALLAMKRMAIDRHWGHHILYLNANLWFGVKAGGSVGHISGVVNALLQEGYSVDFVTAGGRLMVSNKANVIQLPPPRHFGFPWELNYYRFHFDVVEQVRHVIAERRADAIYQRLSIANYSGVRLSRELKLPLVLEYNGSEAWIARNWGRPLREQQLAEQVEEVNLRHAHLVVTISDVLRDELRERGVPDERIVVYPNCIDEAMFDPGKFGANDIEALRAKHRIEEDAIVVTFVGTFGQWHGAEVLAHAIRRLIEREAEWLKAHKVHFLLVGDGLRMPEVRAILGENGDGLHVTLAGLVAQADAPRYLACSDILVSPHVPNVDGSRFFGSPTKLFEYMAMGKAIVASRLDQIGDVLSGSLDASSLPHGESPAGSEAPAVLCVPGDVEQLITSTKFLVECPEWRATLGTNARTLALAKYTWRNHVNVILDGLRRISGPS